MITKRKRNQHAKETTIGFDVEHSNGLVGRNKVASYLTEAEFELAEFSPLSQQFSKYNVLSLSPKLVQKKIVGLEKGESSFSNKRTTFGAGIVRAKKALEKPNLKDCKNIDNLFI